jgi:hypothetical protein
MASIHLPTKHSLNAKWTNIYTDSGSHSFPDEHGSAEAGSSTANLSDRFSLSTSAYSDALVIGTKQGSTEPPAYAACHPNKGLPAASTTPSLSVNGSIAESVTGPAHPSDTNIAYAIQAETERTVATTTTEQSQSSGPGWISTTINRTTKGVLAEQYQLNHYVGASLTEAYPLAPSPTGSVGRSRRGGGRKRSIKTRTKSSCRNFRRFLRTLLVGALSKALFITLTYSRDFPTRGQNRNHLDRFIRRLLRRYPEACIVWSLEYQRRGAPHYHLLVLGVDEIPWQWLKQKWNEVIASDCLTWAAATISISSVKDVDSIIGYLTEHGRSERIPEEHIGRFWGVRGRADLYMARREEALISGPEMVQLRRVLDNLKLARVRSYRTPKLRIAAMVRARRRRWHGYGFVFYGQVNMEHLLEWLRHSSGGAAMGGNDGS